MADLFSSLIVALCPVLNHVLNLIEYRFSIDSGSLDCHAYQPNVIGPQLSDG